MFSDELGYVDVDNHKIDTGDNAPIKQRPRRLPYTYRNETSKHVKEMLDQNVIQPSTSAWASPVVLVRTFYVYLSTHDGNCTFWPEF